MSKPRKDMKYLNVNRYLLNKQSKISTDDKFLEEKMEKLTSNVEFALSRNK